MPVRWAVAAIAVAASAVAGCGSSTPAAPPPVSAAPAAPALAVPECGAATDADIAAATGIPDLRRITVDPLHCRWEAGPATAVTFEWFRASPIAARVATDPAAQVTPVRIGDHAGRIFATPQWCEVAVDSGASDFVDWRADLPQSAAAQGCSAVRQLATATLAKAR